MRAPRAFQSFFAAHNRHALLMALLSALLASAIWLGWVVGLYVIVLGALAAIHGIEMKHPAWLAPGIMAFFLLLLFWGALDRFFRRYRPLTDRPILGLHILVDLALWAPRATFAIWDHLRAIQLLSSNQVDTAWDILMSVLGTGETRIGSLFMILPNHRQLESILLALQMCGLLVLRRGEDDWFVRVPSQKIPYLEQLRAAGGAHYL